VPRQTEGAAAAKGVVSLEQAPGHGSILTARREARGVGPAVVDQVEIASVAGLPRRGEGRSRVAGERAARPWGSGGAAG